MEKNKNIDTTLYSEESLDLLNIRELRDIGRKFGVPSPTTMKKQDLIEYILKIVYGEVAPTRSNYGRPNVRDFDMDSYVKKIKKNSNLTDELLKYSLDNSFIDDLKVASPKQNESENNIENRVFVRDGEKAYLKLYAFVDSEGDIEINNECVKNLKLEDYDVLEVKIEGSMFKVITINGISAGSTLNSFEICGKTLKGGDKHIFYLSTKDEKFAIIDEFVKKCSSKGLNLCIFSNKKYTGECINSFAYSLDDGYSKMYKIFMTMVGECEKLAFEGKDMIVLIENATDFDDMLNSFDDEVNVRVSKNLEEFSKKILNLGNVFVSFRIEKEKCF